MSNALQTTPFAPSPTNDDLEGSQSVPEKNPSLSLSLSSVFSSFLSLVRRNPFPSSFAISAILTGAVAGIVNWSYNRDFQSVYFQIPPNGSGVALVGHSYQLDTTSQTLSIQWEIVGCGTYKLTTWPPANRILEAVGCDALDRAVDVYLYATPEPTYSYDPANFPVTPEGETHYVYNLTTFDMDHGIDFFNPTRAPFDAYSLTVFAFVIEKATNKSVPIVTFTAGEAPNNFVISSLQSETMSNYTYNSGTGLTTIKVQSVVTYIKARRSQVAQAFTTCLLLVNYALTVGSIYIVLAVVFKEEKIDAAVLVLPITIILTIPALRNLYPASPPFGIFIDTFGFFLQMMLVAMSSMVLMYFVAIPKRRVSGNDGSTQLPE